MTLQKLKNLNYTKKYFILNKNIPCSKNYTCIDILNNIYD